MILTQKWHNF